MKSNFKFWRLFLIVLVGLYIIYVIIRDSDTVSIFDGLFIAGLGFVFICVYLYNIFVDRKEFRVTNSKTSFLSTIIGTLLLVSFFITQIVLDSRDNSKLIIQANNDGGFNGCGFEFREDGSYKFFNGSGLGVDYFRGTYTIKDSIITLDKSEIDNLIKSNRLVIRDITTYNSISKVIYQIDSDNKIIDKDLDFIVNEYNIPK